MYFEGQTVKTPGQNHIGYVFSASEGYHDSCNGRSWKHRKCTHDIPQCTEHSLFT